MMSYFDHAHIHLAGEEKYVAGNIAKPGGLLHTSRISTFVTATPSLRVTKTTGDPETIGSMRVCLIPIWKMSHFQK